MTVARSNAAAINVVTRIDCLASDWAAAVRKFDAERPVQTGQRIAAQHQELRSESGTLRADHRLP